MLIYSPFRGCQPINYWLQRRRAGRIWRVASLYVRCYGQHSLRREVTSTVRRGTYAERVALVEFFVNIDGGGQRRTGTVHAWQKVIL